MSRRILVTGRNGFIGRRAVESLRATGFEVSAPERSELDVAEGRFPSTRVDTVVHLAARTFVPASWEDPADFFRVNAQGTLNVLEHCRRIGARLVNIGAYCYGKPDVLPTPESAPLRPGNPYALSKAAADQACQFYRDNFGMAVTTLRLFNVYGLGQPPHFLVPTIVDQAVDPKCATITVTDATARRDYVHAEDVVSAIVTVVSANEAAGVYNVGSGQSHSVAEIADLVSRAAGVDKPLVGLGKQRPNEIPDAVADITAIARDLGWRPTIGLADGLAKLVADRLSYGRSSRLLPPST